MQPISRNGDKKIIYQHTVSSPTGREVLPLTDVCATIFQNSAGVKEAKIRGTFKDFSSTPIPPLYDLHPACLGHVAGHCLAADLTGPPDDGIAVNIVVRENCMVNAY